MCGPPLLAYSGRPVETGMSRISSPPDRTAIQWFAVSTVLTCALPMWNDVVCGLRSPQTPWPSASSLRSHFTRTLACAFHSRAGRQCAVRASIQCHAPNWCDVDVTVKRRSTSARRASGMSWSKYATTGIPTP